MMTRDMIPADPSTGEFQGHADALYLWETGLENPRLSPWRPSDAVSQREGPVRASLVTPPDPAFGWTTDSYRGAPRVSLFGQRTPSRLDAYPEQADHSDHSDGTPT
jgi:hypothetical protein